jgi:hypothetical protein
MATAFCEADMTGLKSRSFTVSNPPLTAVERVALDHCSSKARNSEPVTQMSLADAIGSQNTTGGTSAGVLARLESKGYITRQVYQRGVQVCIVATGECTAPPSCLTPHWRSITDRVPVPAIHQVRQRDMNTALWIETEARAKGRDMADFLMELVRRGVQDYRAEMAQC